jgi:hypothetical protein
LAHISRRAWSGTSSRGAAFARAETRMIAPVAKPHVLSPLAALAPRGDRRGAPRARAVPATPGAPGGLFARRGAGRASVARRVFSPGRPQPGGEGNDLTRERVSAESILRAAQKAERQRAAMRTALGAAGVARAEALRVGIEHRCAHSLMDALPVDDVLGGDDTCGSLEGLQARLNARAVSCDDKLASRFGLAPAGADPETDLDRAVLQALHERFDSTARRALLSGNFKHRNATVLSSLLVDDETYVQRFEVRRRPRRGEERSSGAEIDESVDVLTATFALDERLAPCYKSASVVKQWALKSVVGEVAF